jgi:hypothetical protein
MENGEWRKEKGEGRIIGMLCDIMASECAYVFRGFEQIGMYDAQKEYG